MFKGSIVWRGIVYTVLMAIGEDFIGVWLVRFALPSLQPSREFKSSSLPGWCWWKTRGLGVSKRELVSRIRVNRSRSEVGAYIDTMATTDRGDQQQQVFPVDQSQEVSTNVHPHRTKISTPRSLYPASIIGAAMISRGEIGFLIASIAESKGIFTNTS